MRQEFRLKDRATTFKGGEKKWPDGLKNLHNAITPGKIKDEAQKKKTA